MSTETRAEERYRSSFERNPVGIYRTTLEGRILDCNDACARLFGYENRAQFLERAASDFYFDGADRQHVIATLREEAAGGRIVTVCNELIPATRAALIDGTLDLVLATPFGEIAARAVDLMAKACAGESLGSSGVVQLPATIYIRENI